MRAFLILAHYATRCVFNEQMELIKESGGLFRLSNFVKFLAAWAGYLRVEVKLSVYEAIHSFKSRVGLRTG